MSEWFIYTLEDPRDGAIRYVGKTSCPGRRLRDHMKDARAGKQSHRCNWIRSLSSLGVEPEMVFIESGTGDGWQKRERFWIKTLRASCRLVNGTDGGEGSSGLVMSDAAKAMLREHRLGAVMAEESKAKLSAHFKGKALSEEHREKMRGVKRGDEARANMSEARRLQWASYTDEERARRLAKLDEARCLSNLNQPAKPGRRVVCVETGDAFDSIRAAARWGGVTPAKIRRSILKRCKANGRTYREGAPL
jgi:hypothetical protein